MARKTKEDAEKTRIRILASALSLFSKKGYDNTTFNDIAARLKMTKGAVYWHFDSKSDLLVALIKLALEKFRRQAEDLLPKGELTFPSVAEMMVKHAGTIIKDPKGVAFFRLTHDQLRWGDASMAGVREQLIEDAKSGPREIIRRALENDARAGRIRSDVNVVSVSSASMALWNGLVKAQIENMLECNLCETLHKFYLAMWNSIKKEQV